MKTNLHRTLIKKNGGSIIKAQEGTGLPTILNPNIRQQTKPRLIMKRHINSDNTYGYNIQYSKPNENNKYLHDIYETDIEEIKPYTSINSSGFRIVPHTIGSRRDHYTKEINPKNQYVKITEDSGDVAYGNGFGTFYEQPYIFSENETPSEDGTNWADKYTRDSKPFSEKKYEATPNFMGFANYEDFSRYKKNFNDR